MYTFADFIRLMYEIFMYIYVPYMIFFCNCMRYICVRLCYRENTLEANSAFEVCTIALKNCCVRYFCCPCWVGKFISDCITDIRYRSFDHARRGCFKYHHEDSCSNKSEEQIELEVENLNREDNQQQQQQQQPQASKKKKDSCIGIYKKYISRYDAKYRREEEEKEREEAHRKERMNNADRQTEAGEDERLLVVEVEQNVNRYIEVRNV